MLYSYPKESAPGCPAEACAFRDQYEGFRDLGAQVVDVNSASEASPWKFARKHRLPFPLLADASRQVRKFGEVPQALPELPPGRVTFVIGAAGKLACVFNSMSSATDHASQTKEARRQLASFPKAGLRLPRLG